jgi:hypothetical protein
MDDVLIILVPTNQEGEVIRICQRPADSRFVSYKHGRAPRELGSLDYRNLTILQEQIAERRFLAYAIADSLHQTSYEVDRLAHVGDVWSPGIASLLEMLLRVLVEPLQNLLTEGNACPHCDESVCYWAKFGLHVTLHFLQAIEGDGYDEWASNAQIRFYLHDFTASAAPHDLQFRAPRQHGDDTLWMRIPKPPFRGIMQPPYVDTPPCCFRAIRDLIHGDIRWRDRV